MKRKSHLPRITQKEMRSLVYQHLQAIDTPRALSIYIIMRYTDENEECYDDEITRLACDPAHYLTAEAFSGAYEATELVRKWTGLVLSWDPEQAAFEKFEEAERQCAATNRRIRTGEDRGSLGNIPEKLKTYLTNLLGPVDQQLLSRCVSEGGWGKGVTSSCKGKWLTEYHKLAAKPQATQAFAELALCIRKDVNHGLTQEIEVVPGSTLAFVPKDARAHRSIAVEPSMNLYLQKGIGSAIRRRLKRRWGMNLDSQTRNQELARQGALDGSFATIDLSSASDTVAYATVEDLLPDDWLALLRTCRCTFTTYRGREIFLHKWSSMGNGYTFELETIIFASFVRASIRPADWYAGRWAVYGDDIVVPTYAYEGLCKILAYYGFTLNPKKSFCSGPFRESCGADFFEETPVRPLYLKKVDWVTLVNWANWLSARKRSLAYRRTWDTLAWALGPNFPRGPSGPHGLLCLFVDEWTHSGNRTSKTTRKGRIGYVVDGLRWLPETISSREVDGLEAVVAHLRLLTARSTVELSDAWLLTARESGRWVRTRSLCEEWPGLPLL